MIRVSISLGFLMIIFQTFFAISFNRSEAVSLAFPNFYRKKKRKFCAKLRGAMIPCSPHHRRIRGLENFVAAELKRSRFVSIGSEQLGLCDFRRQEGGLGIPTTVGQPSWTLVALRVSAEPASLSRRRV